MRCWQCTAVGRALGALGWAALRRTTPSYIGERHAHGFGRMPVGAVRATDCSSAAVVARACSASCTSTSGHATLTHSTAHTPLTCTPQLRSAQSPLRMASISSPGRNEVLFLPFSPSVTAWLDSNEVDSSLSWALPPLVLADRPSSSLAIHLPYDECVAHSVDPPSPPSPPASISSSQSDLADTVSQLSCDASSTRPAAASSNAGHSSSYLDHRRVDLQRRQREKVALLRLDELLAGGATDESLAADGGSAEVSGKAKRRKRRQKLSVLDASAARIQRLERQLRMAKQDNRMLSEEISTMAARERLCVQWMDASKSLHSGGLIHDRLVRTLIDCGSGRLLHANGAFFDFTGFTPGGALQRVMNRIDPRTSTGERQQLPDSEYPLVRARRSRTNDDGQSGEAESTEWTPQQACKQYPRSVRLMQELMSGQRDDFKAPFRCRWADGCVYEFNGNFWVADWEWVREADGSRSRRPVRFCISAFWGDWFQVDED